MDASSKHRRSGNSFGSTSKDKPPCPWRAACSFTHTLTGEYSIGDCPTRLKHSTCTWLFAEAGDTAVRLIRDIGETSVARIGTELGIVGDRHALHRLKLKLNELRDHEILTSRRNKTKAGENLYRLGPRATPIVQQCETSFQARCKAMEDKIAAKLASAAEDTQKLARMRESFHP